MIKSNSDALFPSRP